VNYVIPQAEADCWIAGCGRGVGECLTLKASSRRDKLFDAWSERA